MFDITTARDFYAKLLADFEDFKREPGSARIALNCISAAYHLHEWVWGDLVKHDLDTQRKLGVHDLKSFRAWINRACIWFGYIQEIANRSKHFGSTGSFATARINEIENGPFLAQVPYLVIDNGEASGSQRWLPVGMLIDVVVRFWDEFFVRFYPHLMGPALICPMLPDVRTACAGEDCP
jgi:hypothetical protein